MCQPNKCELCRLLLMKTIDRAFGLFGRAAFFFENGAWRVLVTIMPWRCPAKDGWFIKKQI